MPIKSISYNRETKEFDASLDGKYIGGFPSKLAAEVHLDSLVHRQLTQTA